MTIECDVLIVGAGPAGCSAAFFLKHFDKENKLEIYLLERLNVKKYKRYHNMCGEGVSEDLFKDISPIKASCIIEKIRKLREHWPGNIVIETPMRGYIIDRPRFFGYIVDQYTNSGGRYVQNSLTDFKEKEDGVKVKIDNGEFIITRYLIAADGANSLIRKKLGLGGRVKTLLQYIVDEEPEHDTIILEYDEKWKGDYKWTFPHGDTMKIGFPHGGYKEKINGKILAKQGRTVGFGGIENNVHGNIMLVGDAACQNNPITKGGIRSGMVAGKMAAEAILDGNPKKYDKMWKKSDFASPMFIKTFDRLKTMTNDELAKHMEPFKNGVNVFSTIKSLLFYRKYHDMYRTYELSNKVGW